MKQKELIHNSDWDNLIILDACRYDFFKEISQKLPNLSGELKKVQSSGTATREFTYRTFKERYNYELFSCNAYLNSQGKEMAIPKLGFYDPSEHFAKIHDIWKEKWNQNLGTVPPEALNQYVEENIEYSGEFDGKILWYIQPHTPHIGAFSINADPTVIAAGNGVTDGNDIFPESVRKDETYWKLFKTSYYFNLLRVLYNVAEILPTLQGKTVVTADHGEKMDGKSVLHRSHSDEEILKNVPWLEVDGENLVNLKNCSDEKFVEIAYENVLKRSVEDKGLKDKVDSLKNDHNFNRRNLYEVLISSKEHMANKEWISKNI